jgi:hypothetical protein
LASAEPRAGWFAAVGTTGLGCFKAVAFGVAFAAGGGALASAELGLAAWPLELRWLNADDCPAAFVLDRLGVDSAEVDRLGVVSDEPERFAVEDDELERLSAELDDEPLPPHELLPDPYEREGDGDE